jgi:hypothetical protein
MNAQVATLLLNAQKLQLMLATALQKPQLKNAVAQTVLKNVLLTHPTIARLMMPMQMLRTVLTTAVPLTRLAAK